MKRSASSTLLLLLIQGTLAAPLLGCGSPPGDETGTAAGEEALRGRAHPPIAQVLQYVGAYTGDGPFASLELHRDGTFTATVDGARKTGRYEGPHAPASVVKLVLITQGASFTATVPSEWTTKQRLVVTHAGRTETLVSPWDAGSESMCDDTHGSWTDDDPDPTTGLFCVCPPPKQYIPSLGGCTR